MARYLSRDTALVEQAIALEEAKIRAGKTQVEQDINIQFSTGTMKMRFHPETSMFEFAPAFSASIPAFNDSTLDVSVPVSRNGDETLVENTSFSASTAIISSKGKQREVDLLNAERAVLVAERAFNAQSLKSEKAFYGELLMLYDSISQMLTKRDTQYTKELDFAAVRAQGFTHSSSRFRTAELEASSARRAANESERDVESAVESFSRKCDTAISVDDILSLRVPDVVFDEQNGFSSRAKESFLDIESARWNFDIGEKSRNAKSDFALYANAGVTLNNTSLDKNTGIDTGLSLSWRGLNITFGVSFPIETNESRLSSRSASLAPLFQSTIKINPLTFRSAALDKKLDALNMQKELLAIKKADEKYDDTSAEREKTLSDILWRETERAVQAQLYAELANDMDGWFKSGLVSETEYRQALTNEQKARLSLLQSAIEKISYKIDTALLFIQ